MIDIPNFGTHNSGREQILLRQRILTQTTLDALGVNKFSRPADIPKIDGRVFMIPERVENLRSPHAVEILGMPGAGKTTMLNRYMEELWFRNKRHEVALVRDGARSIKNEYCDLRYTDPFLYSQLGGLKNFTGYIDAIVQNTNSGMRMVASDRGQIDRRIFRRVYFNQGFVDPGIMAAENDFIEGSENTPIQICGIVMFMVRPEVTMQRIKKEGPVVNMNFLPQMYEQLLRLHYEILNNELPQRIYTCIDAEKSQDQVYEQFRFVMDECLNIKQYLFIYYGTSFSKRVR